MDDTGRLDIEQYLRAGSIQLLDALTWQAQVVTDRRWYFDMSIGATAHRASRPQESHCCSSGVVKVGVKPLPTSPTQCTHFSQLRWSLSNRYRLSSFV